MLKKIGLGFLALMIIGGCSNEPESKGVVDSKGRVSYPVSLPEQQGYINRDNETNEVSNPASAQKESPKNTLASDYSWYTPDVDVTGMLNPVLLQHNYNLSGPYLSYYNSTAFKHFIKAANYGMQLHEEIEKGTINPEECEMLADITIGEAREFIHSRVSFESFDGSVQYLLEEFYKDQKEAMNSFIEAAQRVKGIIDEDGVSHFNSPDYIFLDSEEDMDKCFSFLTDNSH